MPECPEIAIMKDQLQPLIANQTLTDVQILSGRYFRHPETWNQPTFLPAQILSIETHGKLMIWNFDRGQHLFAHAAMSGRWSLIEEKHNHIKFSFQNRPPLFFNDARNFGSVQFGDSKTKTDKLSKLGIDPLKEVLTFDKISAKLNFKKPIGELLLNQSIFAGIGNYLRAEILYAAKISPFRPAYSLSQLEWATLCQQTNHITNLSYQNGGATIQSFKNLNGDRGNFSQRFHCYGRTSDPNNLPISHQTDSSGRTIWYQKDIQI